MLKQLITEKTIYSYSRLCSKSKFKFTFNIRFEFQIIFINFYKTKPPSKGWFYISDPMARMPWMLFLQLSI